MQDRLLQPLAGAIGPDVHLQHTRQALENRTAEERVTRQVPAHEPGQRPTTTGVHRRQVPCCDLPQYRRSIDLVQSRAAAQVMRIPVREYHDVSRRQLDIRLAVETDPG